MNKDSLVQNLRRIIPGVDDAGSVSTWGFHALDETHWYFLLTNMKHLYKMTPDHPQNEEEAYQDVPQSTPSTPYPPWPHTHSQPPHFPSEPSSPPPIRSISGRVSSGSEGFGRSRPFNSPSPSSSSPVQSPPINSPSSPPPCSIKNYDKRRVRINMRDSLGVLRLEMGVTVREVNVRYRFLAQIRHTNKHDTEVTVITSEEAVELFKLLSNAQQYLRTTIRSL